MNGVRLRLTIYLTTLAGVLVAGAAAFMLVEGKAPLDAFYFTIVTIATVGYGDVHPETAAGKVSAIVVIFLGVGAFLGVVANAAELMLSRREHETRMNKLNMVIGVFFSEIGSKLLARFARWDAGLGAMGDCLLVTGQWTHETFGTVRERLRDYAFEVDAGAADLAELRDLLASQRAFLVRLLENPVLLEHEAFTDLLRAVFHLAEELDFRDDVNSTPEPDKAHLAGDIARAYRRLVVQWLDYMGYLKDEYPYLFSLAVRVNPFRKESNAVVAEP